MPVANATVCGAVASIGSGDSGERIVSATQIGVVNVHSISFANGGQLLCNLVSIHIRYIKNPRRIK
jgi:hypothetical protein